jgi:Protein of unknown function (DUF3363)
VMDWRRQVTQERFTPLDRWIKSHGKDGIIYLTESGAKRSDDVIARTRADLTLQRLRQLETMGLATRESVYSFHLTENWTQILQRQGERGDIIKTIHRTLAEQNISHRAGQVDISTAAPETPIVGRLIGRGLADELKDRHYVIIDGLDGRIHYRDIARQNINERLGRNPMVSLSKDRNNQARLTLLSNWDLDAQVNAQGATWLDKKLLEKTAPQSTGTDPEIIALTDEYKGGFAREVAAALAKRKAWLIDQGLAQVFEEQFTPNQNLLGTLRQRDLQRAAQLLGSDMQMDVDIAGKSAAITGRYIRRLDLASGSFAVIDRGQTLAIAPWSPALEKWRGQRVSGVSMGTAMNWKLAKDIGLGIG